MFKLNNTSPAWLNYYVYTQGRFNDLGLIMSIDAMSGRLSEYGGIVLDLGNSQGWQPYFETEQDMTLFVLKWA